ncbi:MAG: phosphoenolpyruvate carboxylase, partial [Candidatus Omnitrophica bacterium]|nr:phosphoenolpyruvate carboxylase [Candidatus Omnitrophota bacterium]
MKLSKDQQRKLSPLRRDVHFLGVLLGRVLIQQEGKEFFLTEERIRKLAIVLRKNRSLTGNRELYRILEDLPASIAEKIIRAFSTYFQLVNVAEENHRLRRKRYYESLPGFHPQRGSIEDVVIRLRRAGVPFERLAKRLADLSIILVLTAHPTQALPPSILAKQRAIWDLLLKRQMLNPVPREAEEISRQLLAQIMGLWQTEELRHARPSVEDEVEQGLYYLSSVLYDALPDVVLKFRDEIKRAYGQWLPLVGLIRAGSWIGGDKDGNPNVTHVSLRWALLRYRKEILSNYLRSLEKLQEQLTHSDHLCAILPAFRRSLATDRRSFPALTELLDQQYPHQPYRQKLALMSHRLSQMLRNPVDAEEGYRSAQELLRDVELIRRSLLGHHADIIAQHEVAKLSLQVLLFGFSFVQLDVREHSQRHWQAFSELAQSQHLAAEDPQHFDESNIPRNDFVSSLTSVCRRYEMPLGRSNARSGSGSLSERVEWVAASMDAEAADAHRNLGSSSLVFSSYPFALFMLQKYWDNPVEGLVEVVNFGGDTDTTGAIYGALARSWKSCIATRFIGIILKPASSDKKSCWAIPIPIKTEVSLRLTGSSAKRSANSMRVPARQGLGFSSSMV